MIDDARIEAVARALAARQDWLWARVGESLRAKLRSDAADLLAVTDAYDRKTRGYDADQELGERMRLIERFARAFATADCDNCDGDGMDEEGSEWSLCECALDQLRAAERTMQTEGDGCDHEFQHHPQSDDFGTCSKCGAEENAVKGGDGKRPFVGEIDGEKYAETLADPNVQETIRRATAITEGRDGEDDREWRLRERKPHSTIVVEGHGQIEDREVVTVVPKSSRDARDREIERLKRERSEILGLKGNGPSPYMRKMADQMERAELAEAETAKIKAEANRMADELTAIYAALDGRGSYDPQTFVSKPLLRTDRMIEERNEARERAAHALNRERELRDAVRAKADEGQAVLIEHYHGGEEERTEHMQDWLGELVALASGDVVPEARMKAEKYVDIAIRAMGGPQPSEGMRAVAVAKIEAYTQQLEALEGQEDDEDGPD